MHDDEQARVRGLLPAERRIGRDGGHVDCEPAEVQIGRSSRRHWLPLGRNRPQPLAAPNQDRTGNERHDGHS
jgi:hypothetical protein